MPSIFICYRREDSAAHAGRLHDRLAAEFGGENVVIDIDLIGPADPFAHIRKVVSTSDIVLVVIGPQWARAADRFGKRRIDDPDDFVLLEIETALKREVRTIPVLVGGADFPPFEAFPEAIRDLTRRQAFQLRDHRWREDVRELVERIREMAAPSKPVQPDPIPPPPTPRRGKVASRVMDEASGTVIQSSSFQPEPAEGGDVRDIFISYVEEDGPIASDLARELRAQQQSTWTYEEDGIPGVSYLTQVFRAIDSCRVVILLASVTSVRARQVIKEVEAAHERDKMLIAVRVGMTHQELTASNEIIRMAIGTAVTLPLDQRNVAGTAKRIANAVRAVR